MKQFFKLLIILVLSLGLASCGPSNKIVTGSENEEEVVAGSQKMRQESNKYNTRQVDSMCITDALPRNFEEWIRRTYTDYETNAYVVRYVYLKLLNNNCELVYIVTPRGDMYIVSKRIVTTE